MPAPLWNKNGRDLARPVWASLRPLRILPGESRILTVTNPDFFILATLYDFRPQHQADEFLYRYFRRFKIYNNEKINAVFKTVRDRYTSPHAWRWVRSDKDGYGFMRAVEPIHGERFVVREVMQNRITGEMWGFPTMPGAADVYANEIIEKRHKKVTGDAFEIYRLVYAIEWYWRNKKHKRLMIKTREIA